MAESAVVNKWNATAVKNALDDAAKEVLSKKHGLVESHALFDGRLFLCTISVIIAGVAMLWDYLYPHPQSRFVLITCVCLYFLLSGVITVYVMFIEKNTFYRGMLLDPTGLDSPDVCELSSKMNKYDPTYDFTMTIHSGTGKKKRTASLKRCVADFFDCKGRLRPDLFNPVILNLFADLSSIKKSK